MARRRFRRRRMAASFGFPTAVVMARPGEIRREQAWFALHDALIDLQYGEGQ